MGMGVGLVTVVTVAEEDIKMSLKNLISPITYRRVGPWKFLIVSVHSLKFTRSQF